MGNGYSYKCIKCGNEYTVNTGIGFMFPNDYQRIMKEISKGRYGEKRKALYRNIPGLAVDAGRHYYECKDCGYWSVEENLDLYEPKKEVGEVHCVMPDDLKRKYKFIDKYDHRCPECNGQMKQRDRKVNVRCPSCRTVNEPLGSVDWD